MKVSIIIPVYNVSRYLPQCLDAIAAQSYPDWEAIVVDDGSTDNSGEICDRYAAVDPRFKVIHKDNGGAANAKNTGLDYAGGTYITFIDSDDYVEQQWLETIVQTAQTEQADAVQFGFDKVYQSSVETVKGDQLPLQTFSAEEYLSRYLTDWTNSLFWNKLFRKELIGEIRFRKERRCIDDEFFTYKVLSGAKKIVVIQDILYHYRQRASSAVSTERNKLQITEDALEVLIERYEWIGKRFPNLKTIYLQHDINILFYFSGFYHNEQTAAKFRRIARYYLKQALLCGVNRTSLFRAIKLQLISSKSLQENKKEHTAGQDLSQYFE